MNKVLFIKFPDIWACCSSRFGDRSFIIVYLCE